MTAMGHEPSLLLPISYGYGMIVYGAYLSDKEDMIDGAK